MRDDSLGRALDEGIEELLRSGLVAELPVDAVVAKSEVRNYGGDVTIKSTELSANGSFRASPRRSVGIGP
jgi:hypothetical protein